MFLTRRRATSEKLEVGRPITLRQLTIRLQQHATEPVKKPDIQESGVTLCESENTIACNVAMGLAKRRPRGEG